MSRKLRVGLASLVHDHVWSELRHWNAQPEVEVVAVGEADARLRQRAVEAGVPTTYPSWQAMLEAETLDIVQASSENSSCAEVTEAAMARGAHVISEKPMAATLAQADQMLASAERHGRRLMVNWPNEWDPYHQEFERRLLDGAVGRPIHLKRRNAHNGPREIGCDPAFVEWLYDAERNGAGAFMDYCCYGACMASLYLGQPRRVTGVRGVLAKDYPLPDDNATILLQYDQAVAVIEASWTEVANAGLPHTVVLGTEGAMTLGYGSLRLQRAGGPVEEITPAPLVAPRQNGPQYFVHCITTGEEIQGMGNARTSRAAQEILEAGLRAADGGRHVDLPLT